MRELNGDTWEEVSKAIEKKKATFFWTTMTQTELEYCLKKLDISFSPSYTAPGKCRSVSIPFNNDKKKEWISIKFVPEKRHKDDGTSTMGHKDLSDFCRRVSEEHGLKLYYKGESAAVVGHNFIKALFVDKRESIPMALRKELVEKQKNKCALCNDLIREMHHSLPVAEGGTNKEIVLVCRTCHSEETEKQFLKGGDTTYFQSQMPPEMMEVFKWQRAVNRQPGYRSGELEGQELPRFHFSIFLTF